MRFFDSATGGTARCELFGNGSLDISFRLGPGVTVGSVEGDGLIFLGANNLTIGSNNLSTTFAGVIQDSGSVTKIGAGKLTLSGANTYSGGTIVNAGNLLLANRLASGTGTFANVTAQLSQSATTLSKPTTKAAMGIISP